MEMLVVVVVALWAIRRLIVDASFAIRGQTPPSYRGRSGSRRPGARSYLGDVWSDAWRSASERRATRRARRAAGQSRFPRLAAARAAFGGWWRSAGGGREYHRRGEVVTDQRNETALDRAWQRVEDRRAARQARKAGGGDVDQPQRPVPPPSLPRDWDDWEPPPEPQRPTQPAADTDQRPPPTGDGRRNGQPTGTDPGETPAPDQPADSGPDRATGPRQPPQPTNRDHKENDMAEATGLNTSIAFASDQQQANQEVVGEIEQWIASLQAQEVSGEAIAGAYQAMEQQQAAAASWAQAQAALERHRQVQEAYNANPDAGSKQFLQNE
jgi:hypothetical protein